MKLAVASIGAVLALTGAARAAPGSQLFAQRCAMCHQATGAGIAGAFPRLAGRAAAIAQRPAGRRYLALVLLNGMAGPITVDRQPVGGLMPSMAALSDADIAAVLSHVLTLGAPPGGRRPAPFTAAEIAAIRKEGGLSASAVGRERAKLAAAGQLP